MYSDIFMVIAMMSFMNKDIKKERIRMAGKYSLTKFADIDFDDPFFDSLKKDYPGSENSTGFVEWANQKAKEGATALTFDDEEGVGAFIRLKDENEPIYMKEGILEPAPRTKISTLRIAERFRGQRIGEGAIGLVLWKWRDSDNNEIYVTIYEKQNTLIQLLEKFGFILLGYNLDGECIYMKSRKNIDYSDPYKSFPFINPNFEKGGYLLMKEQYHDTMFPYFELKNTLQAAVALNVTNGLSKIYVGAQYTKPHYKPGEPIFIYRIYDGPGQKRYKSCLTSICIVTDVIMAKRNGNLLISFDDLLKRISNKSVFDTQELRRRYASDRNMFVIEMLYYGYFGAGNNVNMDWLDKNNLWSGPGSYPTEVKLTQAQVKRILEEGKIDVQNIIID